MVAGIVQSFWYVLESLDLLKVNKSFIWQFWPNYEIKMLNNAKFFSTQMILLNFKAKVWILKLENMVVFPRERFCESLISRSNHKNIYYL
jgi:hypothetical protein